MLPCRIVALVGGWSLCEPTIAMGAPCLASRYFVSPHLICTQGVICKILVRPVSAPGIFLVLSSYLYSSALSLVFLFWAAFMNAAAVVASVADS